MPKKISVSFTLNGDAHEALVDPWHTLLNVLRDDLGLSGTKEGCGNGNCGSCTVILNGRAVDSCMVLAPEINSKDIKTVEGLAKGDTLHPLQEAFINEGALQCGFCTPGLLMSIERLLSNKSNPSEQEIRSAIAGNICRCTGYDKIIKAVQSLALRKEE